MRKATSQLHIPYLYDFSGQPWKTQRRVRQLMMSGMETVRWEFWR